MDENNQGFVERENGAGGLTTYTLGYIGDDEVARRERVAELGEARRKREAEVRAEQEAQEQELERLRREAALREFKQMVERLREVALADNPKIAGVVWWIIFGAVILGGAALNLPWGVLSWALFVGIVWGAQAWICRLAKRGRGGVPPYLVVYLTANAMEGERALEAGDAWGVAMHAQIERDTLCEIYLYMRGVKK